MDFTIMSIDKIRAAFARALNLHADREEAARAAAQALGITAESVLGALRKLDEELS